MKWGIGVGGGACQAGGGEAVGERRFVLSCAEVFLFPSFSTPMLQKVLSVVEVAGSAVLLYV